MTIEERNKKVEENLKLVSYALNLLKIPWNEDYFQQGVLELIRCVENYNENKGYKFSTYATKCITLKLKDYIKRDYVIKPKLTGEGGGKVYGPPVVSLTSIAADIPGERPIMLQDILATEMNWDYLDLKIELERLIKKGILKEIELQLFIDSTVNNYPIRELIKKYKMKKEAINEIISKTRLILQENILYNYFEGGK